MPTAVRKPVASCTLPVAPSTGMSAAPFAPPRIADRGHGHQRTAQPQCGQRATCQRQRRHQHHRRCEQTEVEGAGEPVAQAHRQGALAHLAVRGDVAQVVDHEQRAGQAPGKAAGEPGNRGEALAHHVRGAGGGHQPEEHEHEHLTEAEVAIRLGPTGVPPPGEHRRSPDHEQPPAGDRREQQPGHGRDAESCKCCSLHRRAQRGHSQPAAPDPPALRRYRARRRCSRWRSSHRPAGQG